MTAPSQRNQYQPCCYCHIRLASVKPRPIKQGSIEVQYYLCSTSCQRLFQMEQDQTHGTLEGVK